MKNLFLTILFLVIVSAVYAQTVTTDPATFTAEDEVTLTVDATGTSLAGYTGDVWIWAWISKGCSSNCDAPTNVSPAGAGQSAAKMTRSTTNPNVYTITFVPVDFFNKPAGQILQFGLKLKSISWDDGKQTDKDLNLDVESLIFIEQQNRVFPSKFTQEDVVTLYFNPSLTEVSGLKNTDEIYVYTWVNGETATGNDFELKKAEWNDVKNTLALKMTKGADGRFSLTFVPDRFFPGINAGDEIKSLHYIFRNADGNVQTATFTESVIQLN